MTHYPQERQTLDIAEVEAGTIDAAERTLQLHRTIGAPSGLSNCLARLIPSDFSHKPDGQEHPQTLRMRRRRAEQKRDLVSQLIR